MSGRSYIAPTQDLCLHCRGISNLVLCGPQLSQSAVANTSIDLNHDSVWFGPSLGQIQSATPGCALCHVVFTHLWNRKNTIFEGDPTRRVCLAMVNEFGRHSDGTTRWREINSASRDVVPSAGVAAVKVGVERKLHDIEWLSENGTSCHLRVFAPKNCLNNLAPIVLRKEVDDVVGLQTVNTARKWLDDCVNGHWRCHRTILEPQTYQTKLHTVTLPSRVITVSKDSWNVRPTAESSGHYVALSYCWGNTAPIDHFKLLKHNIESFEQDQPIAGTVPKTYRDAMMLTHALGFRYLWVDALCIVQDDDADWEKEARAMASIYQNATVTIAALASEGIHDGLFKHRAPSMSASIPWIELESCGNQHQIGHVFVTPDLPVQQSDTKLARSSLQQELDICNWATRGWTFQEAALSRRILYVGRHNFYWECQSNIFSEDGWDEKVTKELPMKNFYSMLAFTDNALAWAVTEMRDIIDSVDALTQPSPKDSVEMKDKKKRYQRMILFGRLFLRVAGSSLCLGVARIFQNFYDKFIRSLDTAGMTHAASYVALYTARRLSFASDRLIAFEGFAKMLAKRTGQDFQWGVWTNAVAHCLFWRPIHDESPLSTLSNAPSWSWASRIGQVKLPEIYNEDKVVIMRIGRDGDLSAVRFCNENFRVRPSRGVQPASIELQAYLATATRSKDTSRIYPKSYEYLVSLLRLTLRSGHFQFGTDNWLDSRTYILFLDSKSITKPASPARLRKHRCAGCNQFSYGADEHHLIDHLETCDGGKGDPSGLDTKASLLYGLALFDDPAHTPVNFKVMVLSHLSDIGVSWYPKEPPTTTPSGIPKTSQMRTIHPCDRSILGHQWCDGTRRQYISTLTKPLRVYHLLLIEETERPGEYVRIGIGLGYWLPGREQFGGLALGKLAPRSSLILV